MLPKIFNHCSDYKDSSGLSAGGLLRVISARHASLSIYIEMSYTL